MNGVYHRCSWTADMVMLHLGNCVQVFRRFSVRTEISRCLSGSIHQVISGGCCVECNQKVVSFVIKSAFGSSSWQRLIMYEGLPTSGEPMHVVSPWPSPSCRLRACLVTQTNRCKRSKSAQNQNKTCPSAGTARTLFSPNPRNSCHLGTHNVPTSWARFS